MLQSVERRAWHQCEDLVEKVQAFDRLLFRMRRVQPGTRPWKRGSVQAPSSAPGKVAKKDLQLCHRFGAGRGNQGGGGGIISKRKKPRLPE